jgi:peptide/nickel transport system permease protein
MYLFAFQWQILPIFGGYSAGANPGWSWVFVRDVLHHAVLPALSIVLVSVGGWALAMRGMMVTTMGEDYVVFAEAKGLRSATIFARYCIRNAVLPQVTGLALALGQILSGAVLVEVIFGYPGIGALLFQAIEENDFFLIQGVVFAVIVALGFATFVLDLIYPWLDPRIGALLFQAIEENDFFLIQGVVFAVIVALGFATFVLDLIYPWLDPRIGARRS